MSASHPPDSISSPYYDLIYDFIDYSEQTDRLAALIKAEKPNAKKVLDVACGTHEHAVFMQDYFSVDGIDHNPLFISIAQSKNRAGRYFVADMCDFDVSDRYDAIICLHSSICYLSDEYQVERALENFVRHLKPGGLLLIEPWFSPNTFQSGKISLVTGETADLKVARASLRTKTATGSLVEFNFMVAKPDGVEFFVERHNLLLLSANKFLEIFKRLGLSARHDPTYSYGRGLFIGKVSDSTKSS